MKTPYKDKEEIVMQHLIEAYKEFSSMKETHPSHLKDFEDGIHKCQKILMHRILQRDYPDKFPTIKTKQGIQAFFSKIAKQILF